MTASGALGSRVTGLLAVAFAAATIFGATAASDLPALVHPPTIASDHPPLIVLLHGVGADERDMVGLWEQLPKTFLVLSPRAPFPDPGGGYRWYGKTTREADIATSRKIVDLVVDTAVQRFHADPARVFLAGFSQGAVMVYEVALREPGRFRGAAVLSGSIFPSEVAALSTSTDRSHEAFFIGHGTADPRIAFASALAGKTTLARLGVPTSFHAYPGMGHTISDAETRDLSDWLSVKAEP